MVGVRRGEQLVGSCRVRGGVENQCGVGRHVVDIEQPPMHSYTNASSLTRSPRQLEQ